MAGKYVSIVDTLRKKLGREPTLDEVTSYAEDSMGVPKQTPPEEQQPADQTDHTSKYRPIDIKKQKLAEVLRKKTPNDLEGAIEYLKTLNQKTANAFKLYQDLDLVTPSEDGVGYNFNRELLDEMIRDLGPARPERPQEPEPIRVPGTQKETTQRLPPLPSMGERPQEPEPIRVPGTQKETTQRLPPLPSMGEEKTPSQVPRSSERMEEDALPEMPKPLTEGTAKPPVEQKPLSSGEPLPEMPKPLTEGTVKPPVEQKPLSSGEPLTEMSEPLRDKGPQGGSSPVDTQEKGGTPTQSQMGVPLPQTQQGLPLQATATTGQTRRMDASMERMADTVDAGMDYYDTLAGEARQIQEERPEATLSGYSNYVEGLIDQNKNEGKQSARQLLSQLNKNQRGAMAQGIIQSLGKIVSGITGLSTDLNVAKYYSPEKIFDRKYEDALAQQRYQDSLRSQQQDLSLRLNRAKELLNETMKYLDPNQKTKLISQLKGLDSISSQMQTTRSNTPYVQASIQDTRDEAQHRRALELQGIRNSARGASTKPPKRELTSSEMNMYGHLTKASQPITERATGEERENYRNKNAVWQNVLTTDSRDAILRNISLEKDGGFFGRDTPIPPEQVADQVTQAFLTEANNRSSEFFRKNPQYKSVSPSLDPKNFKILYMEAFNHAAKGNKDAEPSALHREALSRAMNKVRDYSVGKFASENDLMFAQDLGFDPLQSGWVDNRTLQAAYNSAPDHVRAYFQRVGGQGPAGIPRGNYGDVRGSGESADGVIQGIDEEFQKKAGLTPSFMKSLDMLDTYEGGVQRSTDDTGNVNGLPTVAGIAPKFYISGGAKNAFGQKYPSMLELEKMYNENRPLFNKYKAVYYNKNYWEPLKSLGIDQMHPALAAAIFDHQVNTGSLDQSRRLVQAASRYQDVPSQWQAISNERKRLYEDLVRRQPNQQPNKNSWMNRASRAGTEFLERSGMGGQG